MTQNFEKNKIVVWVQSLHTIRYSQTKTQLIHKFKEYVSDSCTDWELLKFYLRFFFHFWIALFLSLHFLNKCMFQFRDLAYMFVVCVCLCLHLPQNISMESIFFSHSNFMNHNNRTIQYFSQLNIYGQRHFSVNFWSVNKKPCPVHMSAIEKNRI